MLLFMYKPSLCMYSTAGDTVLHNFTVTKHLPMKNLLCCLLVLYATAILEELTTLSIGTDGKGTD